MQGILDQCTQEKQKQLIVILLICHIFPEILWTAEIYVRIYDRINIEFKLLAQCIENMHAVSFTDNSGTMLYLRTVETEATVLMRALGEILWT